MITKHIPDLLGIECYHLDDGGELAIIDSPFLFYDGDSIPIYLEQQGGTVRIFDDGEILLRFGGFGFRFDEPGDTRFIEVLVESNGVTLNDAGEFEIKANQDEVPAAFARYVTAMLAIVRWEHEDNARVEKLRPQALSAGATDTPALSA